MYLLLALSTGRLLGVAVSRLVGFLNRSCFQLTEKFSVDEASLVSGKLEDLGLHVDFPRSIAKQLFKLLAYTHVNEFLVSGAALLCP